MDYLLLAVLIFIAVILVLFLYAYLKKETNPVIHLHQFNQHAGIASLHMLILDMKRLKQVTDTGNVPFAFVPFANSDEDMRPVLEAMKAAPDHLFRVVLFPEFINERR